MFDVQRWLASQLIRAQAYHLGAERDSAITAHIAKSMQQDSTSVKTISVLGLVFLLGTFVSVSRTPMRRLDHLVCAQTFQAIFGMSFFDFSSNETAYGNA
jgi:3D (Asp-Asp-Asp) domain-containing protein